MSEPRGSGGSGALRRSVRRDGMAVVVVGLACCVFFWRAVLLQGAFFHYDHALQNYPYRAFYAAALSQGRLPLWTSDLFCGFPLLAEGQSNALYPPFLLLFRLLRPWIAYTYYHVLHFALAGVGAYALARVLRVGRWGAVVAGLGYMLSGPVLYHAHHTNIVVGAAWLPVALTLAELGCRHRRGWPFIGLAAVGALLVLGAQPQYTLYTGLVCGLYVMVRLHMMERSGEPRREVVAVAGRFAGAAALAGLISAAQVLPLVELVGRSARGGPVLLQRSPMSPANLMTLVLPHYFGSPGFGSYWGHADPGIYSELSLFMGTTVLVLAVMGAVVDRTRRALVLTGLLLFSLLFSLGFSGSVYGLFAHLPVFRSSRFASRFGFSTALFAALLAGLGLDSVVGGARDRRVRVAAATSACAGAMLAAAGLVTAWASTASLSALDTRGLAATASWAAGSGGEAVWTYLHATLPRDAWRLVLATLAAGGLLVAGSRRKLPGPAVGALACALVFAEMAYAGREFAAVTSPEVYTVRPEIVTALSGLPPGRILRHRYYEQGFAAGRRGQYPFTPGWAADPGAYARCLDRLPPNTNMLWGVPSVGGFCPLQTEALKTLLGAPGAPGTLIEFPLSRALDLVGARYVLTPADDLPAQYVPRLEVGGIRVFENVGALPRAFVVHRLRHVAGDDAALAWLRSGESDLRGEAVVSGDSGAPRLEGTGEGWASVRDDTGDRVVVDCRLKAPGCLILADQYYPGWEAMVDERPAQVLRVDYALRGVAVDGGEHEVEFRFRPASFRWGVRTSVLGLGALALAGVAVLRRRREPRAALADALHGERSPRTLRVVLATGLLFAVLGPVLRPSLWREAAGCFSPRRHMLSAGSREVQAGGPGREEAGRGRAAGQGPRQQEFDRLQSGGVAGPQ
jgi:hypothetical protein